MASGNDMQLGAAVESIWGTRVVPTRFFEIMNPATDFQRAFYVSQGLGGGPWRRRRVQTTRSGGVSFDIEVPTVGFGFWLNLFHDNVVTPVQQGATTAYLQTHTLDGSPDAKSATVQVGVPQVSSTTVSPVDYLGSVLQSMTFAWTAAGVLTCSVRLIAKDEDTAQSLAVQTVPASSLFSFKGGEISIGGSAVADVVGDGSITLEWPLRDDAFPLGSGGTIAKPVPNDRPACTGSFVADFNGLTHFNRVVNSTTADVVLTFTGENIEGAFDEEIVITAPDQGFTQTAPFPDGPGPVSQEVSFEHASAANDAPVVTYMSTDVAV